MLLGPSDRLLVGGACDSGFARPDRWCAFTRQISGSSAHELWVLNVYAALLAPVACDGSSPDCRRLTSTSWVDATAPAGPLGAINPAFYRETLIFYADASSGPGQLHRGPVFAWRPGWTQARQIASTAIQCRGHFDGLTAFCIADVSGDVSNPDTIELRAGTIRDADDSELPRIGPLRTRTLAGRSAWQAQLSELGTSLVFSSAEPDPAVESVQVIDLGGTVNSLPRLVLRDAQDWTLAPGAPYIYFQREDAPGKRTLYVSTLAPGAEVIRLRAPVRDYRVYGPGRWEVGALVDRDDGSSVFQLLNNELHPDEGPIVFTIRGAVPAIFIEGYARYIAWTDEQSRLHLFWGLGSPGPCELGHLGPGAQRPLIIGSDVPGDTASVFWQGPAATGGADLDGFVALAEGCARKRRIGRGVDLLRAAGGGVLLLGDELDRQRRTVTLKYAPLQGGRWPAAGAIRVQENVERTSIALVPTGANAVLFRVAGGTATPEGTYWFNLSR